MKRLLLVSVSALALFAVSACDNKPKAQEATEEAVIYSSVDECKAQHSEDECSQAFNGAQQEQEATAPHMTLGQCVDTYGTSACLPRNSGEYYVPALAGFTFGIVASTMTYHPVYVDLHGSAYYHGTVIGTYHPGCYGCVHQTTVIHINPRAPQAFTSSVTRAPIPPAARNATPSPPSYNYGATKSERGGFGSRASSTSAAPDAKTMPQSASPAPVQRALQAPGASAPRPAPSVSAPPPISRPTPSVSTPSSSSRGGFGGSAGGGGGGG